MKKKVIIFTSGGGGGHISAAKAIESYLGPDYESKTVLAFNEVFKSIDPITLLTFGKLNGEDIYNFFLKRRGYAILNFIYDFGNWYFSLQTKAMTRIATQYLAQEKPDLVISVIPIVNGILLSAAQANNIPFLLVPTDFDVTTFVRGIKNPSYSKFHVTLGLNDPMVIKTIKSAEINPNQISFTGLPMRKDFFEPKDVHALKKEYGIKEGKPVIVLMMGGQGNSSILNFAHQLAVLTIPAHIIFCTGKNTQIKEQLTKIDFNPAATITTLGYTDRISDLLAIADLLITKSGSVSFAEGLYMNVPMILDATAILLYWERLNHVLLQTHNWGKCLKKVKDLNKQVTQILSDPSYYKSIKESLKKNPKIRFDLEIKSLIEKVIS